MKKVFKQLIFGCILAVFILTMANLVYAATETETNTARKNCAKNGDIWLQVEIPGVGRCVSGFPEYIKAIYNLFIGVVGILAVIMIMLGGFQWLAAAGNANTISSAKTTIMAAVIGLILTLTSYTILDFINPDLTDLSLKPEPIQKNEYEGGLIDNVYCEKGVSMVDADEVSVNTYVPNSAYVGSKKITFKKCGERYAIVGSDKECLGFVCSAGSSIKVCAREGLEKHSCTNNITISGLDKYGYPETKRDFKVDGTGKIPCGVVQFNRELIGRSCGDPDAFSCVVDITSGLQPYDKNKDIIFYTEAIKGKDVKIGKFKSTCVPR